MIAIVKGDKRTAAAVQSGLLDRGITATATADCPGVTAAVHSSKNNIELDLSDPEGREAHRTVTDSNSAVNMIDSWIRQGLTTPDLGPEEPAAIIPVVAIAPRSKASIAAVGLGANFGVGFDGSLWFGGRLSGTFFVGKVALGPALAIQADPHLSGDSGKTDTLRTLIDLLAFIEYPVTLKRLGLRPGVDVGASHLTAKTVDSVTLSADGEDDEAEHTVTTTVFAEYQQWEFAVGAHLVLSVPLAQGFAFFSGLFVTVYPTADTAQRTDTGTTLVMAGGPMGAVVLTFGLEYSL